MTFKPTVIDLFSGAGGLALGLELAGFDNLFCLEMDKNACETLTKNRPDWSLVKGDISNFDFSHLAEEEVDLVSGGIPCQSFSYAGKGLGLEDTRGTLFYEYARAVSQIRPKMFLIENVKGLLSHNKGSTLQIIILTMTNLGYKVFKPQVLDASFFNVPQKRERLFIVGVREDLGDIEIRNFFPPKQVYPRRYLEDALKAGDLYPTDVPKSGGEKYSEKKRRILDLIPPGGNWRNLPEDLQRSYLGASFNSSGGKTGIANRLSWNKPCPTLTCSPSQKQTERCHPDETRPLTIREYARIQTFPDCWDFCGSQSSKYKQIGNAVPVNLAHAIGESLFKILKMIERINFEKS